MPVSQGAIEVRGQRELKAIMEAYDKLPYDVRQCIADSLYNVEDTPAAYAMWRLGRYDNREIKELVRRGNIECHEAGVSDNIVPPAKPGLDFKVTRRR